MIQCWEHRKNPILGTHDYPIFGPRDYPILRPGDYPVLGPSHYPILVNRNCPILGNRNYPILGIRDSAILGIWVYPILRIREYPQEIDNMDSPSPKRNQQVLNSLYTPVYLCVGKIVRSVPTLNGSNTPTPKAVEFLISVR